MIAPPRSLSDLQIPEALVEQFVLKALLVGGSITGARLATQLAAPVQGLLTLLQGMKARNLVVHRSATLFAGDYEFQLTEQGWAEAERLRASGGWCASLPVPWSQWLSVIEQQTVRRLPLDRVALLHALGDLEIPRDTVRRIGMAMSAGRSLMLFGPPGNGKTTIAERLTGAYHGTVLVPRMVLVGGHLIRVYDPKMHVEVPTEAPLDPRWVNCRRPTVVAGGELTLSMLELHHNRALGITEAPLQLKAAGGTLVIDDLGRQQVPSRELLNRWIVPLDRGIDHLGLPDGTPLEVPFDPFLVLSTNLDPTELADEAFLRRIPYKVLVGDPDVDTFVDLLREQAESFALTLEDDAVDHLLATYRSRPMRGCHPRDLMRQIDARQRFLDQPRIVTVTALDDVIANYFVDALPR